MYDNSAIELMFDRKLECSKIPIQSFVPVALTGQNSRILLELFGYICRKETHISFHVVFICFDHFQFCFLF